MFSMTERAKTVFRDSIVVAVVLTAIYYAAAFQFHWIETINWVEFVAIFTSFSCTYMCNFQTRWNYPMGVITTFFYSWLFFQSAETTSLAIFNLYLVFSLAYGWYRWRDDTNTRPVTRMNARDWKIHAAIGVAVFVLFISVSTGVAHFRDGIPFGQALQSLGWIDVSLAAASGIAQFALDNKKLENWLIWLAIDIVSIPYFIHVGFYGAAFQYVFFGGNTLWGFYEWYKTYKRPDDFTCGTCEQNKLAA